MPSVSKCATPYCRGVATAAGHSPYCAKCRTRRWKDRHPLHYAYNKLKYRARERGHEFSLTLDQYIEFAHRTDYVRLKGKASLSLSVDRIDPTRGYHVDNIRAITLAENSRRTHSNLPDWMKAEMEQAVSASDPY